MGRFGHVLFLLTFAVASGQTIVTSAGLPYSHRAAVDSKQALNAPLGSVYGLLLDKLTGRLLFHDEELVIRVEPDGSLLALAGMGRGNDGDTADGTLASGLRIGVLRGITQDSNGALYISEAVYGRVYRIALDGTVTTYAGGGSQPPGFRSDGGPATAAELGSPRGLVFDSKGNLDIAEVYCQCIRRVSPAGVISTVYTLPPPNPQVFGPLQSFEGLAIDAQDNLYAAEFVGNQVLEIAPDSTVTAIAGTGVAGFSGDGGPAAAAQLNGPSGVTVDPSGGLYIADTLNNRVRHIAADGAISTFAGTGQQGFSGDGGAAINAQLYWPAQTLLDSAGNVYIADYGNRRARRVSQDGIISTVAGSGVIDQPPAQYPQVGDGGPALTATLANPSGMVFDSAGNLYVADSGDQRARKITPSGVISTAAGNGEPGYSGDGGPATQATLRYPSVLAVDSHGSLYIGTADSRVRKVTPDGAITLVAGMGEGTGTNRFAGDGGPAVNATLNGINGIVVDGQGNIYIVDEINARLRKVDTSGIITTVAGPGQYTVDYWGGLAMDPKGNLYVGVAHYSPPSAYVTVNRVNTDGSLTPVAGNQQSCMTLPRGEFAFDGVQAAQVPICEIQGLTMDTQGNLYIPESFYGSVLKVSPDGTIRRVAGSFAATSQDDGGSALKAEVSASSVAVDATGNLFVSEGDEARIREVMVAPLAVQISGGPINWQGASAHSAVVRVSSNAAEALPFQVQIQTGNGAWLTANRVSGQTGDSLTLFASPSGLAPGVYHGTITVTIPGGTAVPDTLPVTLTLP